MIGFHTRRGVYEIGEACHPTMDNEEAMEHNIVSGSDRLLVHQPRESNPFSSFVSEFGISTIINYILVLFFIFGSFGLASIHSHFVGCVSSYCLSMF